MKRTNEKKGIFLEILRKHGAVGGENKSATEGEIRFAAWCECCQEKVELVSADKSIFKNIVAKTLHVQLPFAGKLLACFNSLKQAA